MSETSMDIQIMMDCVYAKIQSNKTAKNECEKK